jgi:hypothetical protein
VTIVQNWRLYCDTENAWVTMWSAEEPTTCPHDPSGHSIDTSKTVSLETAGTEPTTADGTPLFSLDGPREADKRPIFVNSPIPEGNMPWYCGAGDDAVLGRGLGSEWNLEFTGAGEQSIESGFLEPVWLHDGQLFYSPVEQWSHSDRFDFGVVMPATVATPNGGGTGNCNLVPTGMGFNVIVPAAGDGSHDIDLDQAVPVSAGLDKNGYWDVDVRTGAVSPAANLGAADYQLYDIEIQAYFMRNMPMGNPLGVFDVEAYRSEWISDRWKFRMTVRRVSTTAAKCCAWVFVFRENTT